MNSKILKVLILPLFLFSIASPVNAGIMDNLQARKDKMEEKREEVKLRQEERAASREAKREEVKSEKEERIANRETKRSDVAGKHADRLEEHFANYYTRLNMIMGKIQTRIDATTTKDTAAAKAKLVEAKAKLEEAKTLGASSVAQFRAIDPAKWSEQKSKAEAARDTANKARESFKSTLALMVESIKSLKSAAVK